MHRGILELTEEEFNELFKVFHWDMYGDTPLASKLQYAKGSKDEKKDISVSEEELEIILDDITPIDQENFVLRNIFEKISMQLRDIRQLQIPSKITYRG